MWYQHYATTGKPSLSSSSEIPQVIRDTFIIVGTSTTKNHAQKHTNDFFYLLCPTYTTTK